MDTPIAVPKGSASLSGTTPSRLVGTVIPVGVGTLGLVGKSQSFLYHLPYIIKVPNSAFFRGQSQATFSITVSNFTGSNWTTETIVTEEIPFGLELVSMSGVGWDCVGNVCSRTDTLSNGSSFPPITLSVNVNSDAPNLITNRVLLAGCGEDTVDVSIGDQIPIPTRSSSRWVLHQFSLKPRGEERA